MNEEEKQQIFNRLDKAFDGEKAKGIQAVVQLTLTGEDGGNYYIKIADQKVTASEGVAPNPRVTLSANTKDLMDLFNGKLDPAKAFFQGRLSVKGDMGFAMQLASLFTK
jgi:putative sterol carrier protein